MGSTSTYMWIVAWARRAPKFVALVLLALGACASRSPAPRAKAPEQEKQPLVAAACSAEDAPPPADQVIARIEGQPLTVHAVSRELARQPDYVRQRAVSPEGTRAFVERLIRRQLLAAEARRRGLHCDAAVQARIDQLLADRLLERLRTELVKPSAIADAAVQAYYGRNQALYVQPAKVRVRQLLVGSVAQARGLLAVARRRGGEKAFVQLVERHSIEAASRARGGDLGYLAADDGRWPAPLRQAAFALPEVGALGGPIKTPAGYVVLLKTGEQAAIRRPLSAEAGLIRQRLLATRRVEAVRAFVHALRERAGGGLSAAALANVKVQ